jgi:hypothetical protein
LAEALTGYGNGADVKLSLVNDLAMNAAGVPSSAKPFVDKILEHAEASAGLAKGDSLCH